MLAVQILNRSTLVTQAVLAPIVAALQVQLDRDFLPAWRAKLAADAQQVKLTLTTVDSGDVPIYLVDDEASAPPGALAWHTTDAKGRPYGIVPVRTLLDYGGDLGSTIGHELLELLADPTCEGVAPARMHSPEWPFGLPVSVAYENCDAVEGDTYAISTPLGSVNVPNFVLPSWFDPGSAGPWDFMKRTAGPFKLTSGGYLQYQLFGQWHQEVEGRLHAARAVQSYHCRRHRRQRKLHEHRNPGHHTMLARIETAAALVAPGSLADIISLVRTLGPGENLLQEQAHAGLQSAAPAQASSPAEPASSKAMLARTRVNAAAAPAVIITAGQLAQLQQKVADLVAHKNAADQATADSGNAHASLQKAQAAAANADTAEADADDKVSVDVADLRLFVANLAGVPATAGP